MKSIHQNFEEFTDIGKKFILRWNQMNKDGAQNIMAEEFKISIPSVYRIRKKLELKNLHDPKHPGKHALLKRISRLYRKYGSTAKVARVVGLSSQGVNKLLVMQNVEINPPWVTNIIYYSPRNGMTAVKFNDTIKKLYNDEGMNGKQIATFLKCDHNTVCRRLKAMGISTNQNKTFQKGGYPCLWCNTIMEKVWIARGNRKQKYCGSPCKNKCKDYRKYIDADRKIKLYNEEIRKNWGDKFESARKKILKRENKGSRKLFKHIIA